MNAARTKQKRETQGLSAAQADAMPFVDKNKKRSRKK